MSLIGDALRRKEEEGEINSPTPPPLPSVADEEDATKPASTLTLRGRVPASPPEEATAGASVYQKSPGLVVPPARKKKHRAWAELVLVIVVVVLLLVGGVWAYLAFVEKPAVAPPMAAAVVDEAANTEPVPGLPPSELIRPATPQNSPAPEPTPEPPPSPVATEVIAETSAAPDPEPPPMATPKPVEPEPAATPSPPKLPIIWPSFSLQAAMGAGTSGSVMINSEIVPVGASYADIKVIKITPKGVIMEYEGEQRAFRVRR